MAPEHETTPELGDADIAVAFQEIARGEQAATAMEDQLTALESKIDALLASAEPLGLSEGTITDGTQQKMNLNGKDSSTRDK
ncbi:MAG: hypothetical protein LQ337_000146 [Flavoplaca oasis]|nr:MAG: hypothetical protein LQ337_000146 [Flavoplaca oasis]